MQTNMQTSGKPGMTAHARPEESKLDKILSILIARPYGLNRFEAEAYGCHCLNSTISALRKKGNKIRDEWEWVPTRFGETHVKRYIHSCHPVVE